MQFIKLENMFNCFINYLTKLGECNVTLSEENTLMKIEIKTSLEALMVPQPVKPWTTHSACEPTNFYFGHSGIYSAT